MHEVTVTGVDDPVLGEAKAVVVLKENVHLDENLIKKFLASPPSKQPKFIIFKNSLPKNESGKVLKTVLKEREN